MPKVMDKIAFSATIEQNKDMNAAFVKFPFDTEKLFGTKGQVKIVATFDGIAEYRGSLANMGQGCHILGLTKEIRKKINKTFGDTVNIELIRDIQERTIVIPNDAQALLNANRDAKDFFDTLSYTNRKEFIVWIESAKKDETRAKRLAEFVVKLKNKKKVTEK
jgi:hypothetical protein